jgi:hypothetical protein
LDFSSAFFWMMEPPSPTSSTKLLDLDFSRRSFPLPSHDQRWLSLSSDFSSHWMIAPPSSF